VGDDLDNCPNTPNPDQADSDGDGIANACDACRTAPQNDAGRRRRMREHRQLPDRSIPVREDTDGDGVGEVCDNCPTTFNPDQADSDNNGIGDACKSSAPPPAAGCCAPGVFPTVGLLTPLSIIGWKLRRRRPRSGAHHE
jgi:hypothetical protein